MVVHHSSKYMTMMATKTRPHKFSIPTKKVFRPALPSFFSSTISTAAPVQFLQQSQSQGEQKLVAKPVAQHPQFYVSTPIFYVNSVPHIGHLHSLVIADVLARYNELRTNKPSFLVTGTDEHGAKVQRAAMESSQYKSPGHLCQMVSERFRLLAKTAEIKNNDFIRTTEERHHKAAQHLWNCLLKNGHIYKGRYSGWYSVSDETYYSTNQVHKVLDPQTGIEKMMSIETNKPVEWIEEENYMFKLSNFREKLIDWLEENPNGVISSQRSAIMNQLKTKDLADLSVSRPVSRLSWGIKVPGDDEQVMYVWLDALTNYLTVTGYPWNNSQPPTNWPPHVHVIGKDIIKFHTIYWPAILMGAKIELPKHIIAHGHWKIKSEKISKSLGNVIDPFELIERYGVDGVRFYLMRAPGSLVNDSDWAPDRLEEHYRKDLSGQLGNLLARISTPKLWNKLPPGRRSGASIHLPPDSKSEQRGADVLLKLLEQLPTEVDHQMQSFEIPKALKTIFDVLANANRFLQETAPWHDSTSPNEAYHSIYLSVESLRISAILLQAFIPSKSAQLLDLLGVPVKDRCWSNAMIGKGIGSVVQSKSDLLFPPLLKTPPSPM